MSNFPDSKKIELMREGGRKLAQILLTLEKTAQPGVNFLAIERLAWKLIDKAGGYPSFARVPGYSWATCLNLNDGLVHGVPRDYLARSGDLLNIDIGMFYKGYHTDCAKSFIVGNAEKFPGKMAFLAAGCKALAESIKLAYSDNRVGQISAKIEEVVKRNGFKTTNNYTGHGVGAKLHQPPSIPCIAPQQLEKTPLLSYDMTIAVEVIYMMGKRQTRVEKDGWTVKTADGSVAACFEKTIAVGKDKPLVLTDW